MVSPANIVLTATSLILLLAGCSSYEYCDAERTWLKFKNNCYLFVSKSKLQLSWYSAEDYCRSTGAHLASVHSKEEQDFVKEVVSKNYYGGRQWIGLNAIEGEDKYEWSDGSPVDYMDIVPKEEYFKESCFVFYKEKGGWRKEHCELRHPPICKRPADQTPKPIPPITPRVPAGNCPSDWLQFGQKCYKYFGAKESERKQFKEAKLACMALGQDHDLVSIHSAGEQAFLTQNLYDLGATAWIGFNQITSDEIGHELVFGWTDNSRVNVTYWAPGYPKRGTWKNCVALGFEGVGKGEWIADYCAIHKKGYICQRPPVPSLPPQPPKPSHCAGGASEYRGDCYKFHPDPRTWQDANSTCKAAGGDLLSVTDSFEQAFLYTFLGDKSVWTGLTSIKDTRIFAWSDKQPLYYSNWSNGQPLIPFSNQTSCVYMVGTTGLSWNVTSCLAHMPFVCKFSKGAPPSFPTIIGQCPPEEERWVDIGDAYCYHIPEGKYELLQWGDLSRYCLTKGMEMISLHSEHQSKSLMAYVWKKKYDHWLGLVRSFDRKSFMWSDRSPLNYTNWERDPASGWDSDKDCAGFSTRTSKWSVTGCSEWDASICRAKKL